MLSKKTPTHDQGDNIQQSRVKQFVVINFESKFQPPGNNFQSEMILTFTILSLQLIECPNESNTNIAIQEHFHLHYKVVSSG